MTTVKASATTLGRPARFDTAVTVARAGLAATPHAAYEAGLVLMGTLAGAAPSDGDGRNDSAPDATWIFGDLTWVTWETKSEAQPDGELGADATRQAGAHLRFVATTRGLAPPGDSFGLLMTP